MEPLAPIQAEVRPIVGGRMLHTPVEELSETETVQTLVALGFIQKQLEARIKKLRAYLDPRVDVGGETTPEGHVKRVIDGTTVTRQCKRASEPDADSIKAMLQAAGIPLSDVFDEIKVMQLNPSRLQFLVDSGKLDKTDIERARKVTYALVLNESAELKELLAKAAVRYMAEAIAHGAEPPLPAPKTSRKKQG